MSPDAYDRSLRRLMRALQGALVLMVLSHAIATALGYWLPEPGQAIASLIGFVLTWMAVTKGWI